jgi:hypothetical protein
VTVTNDQFIEGLRSRFAASGMTQRQFAALLGLPRRTFRVRLQKGIQQDSARQAFADLHPEVFNGADLPAVDQTAEFQAEPSKSAALEKPGPAPNAGRKLQALVKLELGRQNVANLSEILVWFLFKATAEERELFREELGDAWKDFLNLTRAMTGPTAFGIAKEEGRLEKWEQQ